MKDERIEMITHCAPNVRQASSLESGTCPHCHQALRDEVVFCHNCGAWLRREPETTRRFKTASMAYNLYRAGVVIVGVLLFYALPITLDVLRKNNLVITGEVLAYTHVFAGTILFFWLIFFYQIVCRWGWSCPACSQRNPPFIFKNRTLTACGNCGTRILPGEKYSSLRRLEERVLRGSCCAICGNDLHETDGYCETCGANVGSPSSGKYHAILRVPNYDTGSGRFWGLAILVPLFLIIVSFTLGGVLLSIVMAWGTKEFAPSVTGIQLGMIFSWVLWGMVKRNIIQPPKIRNFRCPGCRRSLGDLIRGKSLPNFCVLCGITLAAPVVKDAVEKDMPAT